MDLSGIDQKFSLVSEPQKRPQSCRAKQTHLPSVKLTWHLKDGGWESFLLGCWLVAGAIFTYVILLLVQKSQTTTRDV